MKLVLVMTIIAGTATGAMADDPPPLSPCNNGTVGSSDPQSPDFNPYHPDFDWDGDGIPNKDDPDIDGDGIPNCEDGEWYTRPSQNPNWPVEKPIPIWDNPASYGRDKSYDDPSTFAADAEWLLRIDDAMRGDFDGGQPNPGDFLPPYNLLGDPDGDGVRNYLDSDDDGDGIPDINDPDHPAYDPNHPDSDMDCDGIKNKDDPDIDGDGIPNECDPNPANMCEPDTEPLPGEDCEQYGEPGKPEPPKGPGPGDRPDPPPPNDRPDPSPPEDDPPAGPPPPQSPPIPPTPPDPPSDDECCVAICARLDILIMQNQFQSNTLVNILAAVQRFTGDGDTGGSFAHFYRRMISDTDSFRNRVDNVAWTLADKLDLVIHEIKWTNQLLTGNQGGQDPTAPQYADGLSAPRAFLDNQKNHVGIAMGDEFPDWNIFPDISDYSDDEQAPVWTFTVPIPTFGFGGGGPSDFSFTIDFEPFDSVRGPAHAAILIIVTIQALLMIWEEFRRYG